MAKKTNKSFTKRIKVTKNGKMMARTPGGNHFNAKESRSKQTQRKGYSPVLLTNKVKNRFLPHHNTENTNKLGRSRDAEVNE